jgi:hypothetical protein
MQRAKEWAVAQFQVLGFQNISVESFEKKDAWLRGPESAELMAPYSRELATLGLGNSVPTVQKGVEAGDHTHRQSRRTAELRAMLEGSLAGRIVVLNWRFDSAQGETGHRADRDIGNRVRPVMTIYPIRLTTEIRTAATRVVINCDKGARSNCQFVSTCS